MATRTYSATKTRSSRPGWSVIFPHPVRSDARGKSGLKVRRGLGTRDDAEADRLVEQLNMLLADQAWWSLDRRADASRQFDSIVVAAFYDGMEAGKVDSRTLRETIIPLPKADNGYSRIMLVGSTGAGKTTLLRQLIGSNHTTDRFPSTAPGKTTTADIEIITAAEHETFEAVISFMTEHEVRCAVDECLHRACERAIQGRDDAEIAAALLEHHAQRFRLSYILGSWEQEAREDQADDQDDMDFMDFGDYGDDELDTAELDDDEVVAGSAVQDNNARLRAYIERIKKIAMEVRQITIAARGGNDYHDLENANQREDWLEAFIDAVYEQGAFADISLDIMDAIRTRFDLVEEGDFERGASGSSGWPTLWYYVENNRAAFLKQVRWFSSNHDQQYGRLLTPLVDGVRVQGRFYPNHEKLIDSGRKLVLLDGEGLGHDAREADSISTRVTEKFPNVDMILLVDNAKSPMQAAPIKLLSAAGSGGHAHKLAVAFTHFDLMSGDNLSDYRAQRQHVRASIDNAVSSLSDDLGASVKETLDGQLKKHAFYLSSLDKPTSEIRGGFIGNMESLLTRMRDAYKSVEPPDLEPNYDVIGLELRLRDAADGFKRSWRGRLGLAQEGAEKKAHWATVKALNRRIVNRWRKNEFGELRPVANLIEELQNSISGWLDNPTGWNRTPKDSKEAQIVIDAIRQRVYEDIHTFAEKRLIISHSCDWRTAFRFSGTGSTFQRARVMDRIYDEAAPSISSVMDVNAQEFLDEITTIVRDAIESAGGSMRGAG